jgi:hypothetical protein
LLSLIDAGEYARAEHVDAKTNQVTLVRTVVAIG